MKRYLILTVVILMALALAWPALGQREGREGQNRFQELSAEERANLRRERLQNMSEEEREKFKAQMREQFGDRGPLFGRQEQLKIIEAIEEQLAKLKKAVEAGPEREAFGKLREASPEEQAKLRKEWQKIRQEQQQAINDIGEQLAKLSGPKPPVARPDLPINELKAIHELAVKENANKTAERLEKLIAGYQRGPQDRPERPARPTEQPAKPERDVEGAVPGRRASDFTLQSFDGETVNFSSYKGKVVVLEWFNFECPFVMYHYNTKTTMVDLANKYKDKNVVWFAVNSTSHTTPEANKAFAQKYKLPYLILDDRSGRVGHAYNATNTPQMFVIDTKGNIVYEGAIDDSPLGKKKEGVVNYVDKALAELTAGKEVSNPETKPYGCTVKYAQ